MRVIYSADHVRAELRAKAKQLGGQQDLAAAIGVSKSFLCDILAGRRAPTGKVIKFLGLERRTVYVTPDEPLLP